MESELGRRRPHRVLPPTELELDRPRLHGVGELPAGRKRAAGLVVCDQVVSGGQFGLDVAGSAGQVDRGAEVLGRARAVGDGQRRPEEVLGPVDGHPGLRGELPSLLGGLDPGRQIAVDEDRHPGPFHPQPHLDVRPAAGGQCESGVQRLPNLPRSSGDPGTADPQQGGQRADLRVIPFDRIQYLAGGLPVVHRLQGAGSPQPQFIGGVSQGQSSRQGQVGGGLGGPSGEVSGPQRLRERELGLPGQVVVPSRLARFGDQPGERGMRHLPCGTVHQLDGGLGQQRVPGFDRAVPCSDQIRLDQSAHLPRPEQVGGQWPPGQCNQFERPASKGVERSQTGTQRSTKGGRGFGVSSEFGEQQGVSPRPAQNGVLVLGAKVRAERAEQVLGRRFVQRGDGDLTEPGGAEHGQRPLAAGRTCPDGTDNRDSFSQQADHVQTPGVGPVQVLQQQHTVVADSIDGVEGQRRGIRSDQVATECPAQAQMVDPRERRQRTALEHRTTESGDGRPGQGRLAHAGLADQHHRAAVGDQRGDRVREFLADGRSHVRIIPPTLWGPGVEPRRDPRRPAPRPGSASRHRVWSRRSPPD